MAKKSKNINNSEEGQLFSFEELEKCDPTSLFGKDFDGPVTVLGMTFANDDERRAYFREQLRAKLPELRKIEGFPIGADDDIINLSDPPYYTACPNPWLNDFIAEWEQEKLQLEAEGKRQADFTVAEPYSYGVKVGKNSAIYNAHTYHTKVPHEIIMRYILHYTQPGDVVLDGFAGTGMCGVAASQCEQPLSEVKAEIEEDFKENNLPKPIWGKRHAVCGDLSPLCYHISSNYNSVVSSNRLQDVVNEIIDKLKERFGHFYEYPITIGKQKVIGHINYFVWSEVVACNNCGCELNVHDLSFDYDTGTLHKELTCPDCGTKQEKNKAEKVYETIIDPTNHEPISQIKYVCSLLNYSIEKKGRFFSSSIPHVKEDAIALWLPNKIIAMGDEGTRLEKVGISKAYQLYHLRTQNVLSYLLSLIKQEKEFQKPLMFIFTSMLPKLTKMNRYMPQHGSRALVGPMANTLYVPPQNVENNPIDQFEYQANKVIKAFRESEAGAVVQICSATNSSLKDNSVDYIFTDPPFGANIMYSELNSVSESWLRVWTDNTEEAISNKTQCKGLPEYQSIMTSCFKEYFRVLKPGKWMTVEFSNTSAAFWNSLQHSIREAGFIITAITDLNKERGGLHAMLGPTAVKKDLAISCFKPKMQLVQPEDGADVNMNIYNFVEEVLNHATVFQGNDNKSCIIPDRTPRSLFDKYVSYCVQKGLDIEMSSQYFQQHIRDCFIEIDGMMFTAPQAAQYENQRKHTEAVQGSLFFVDSEQSGIAWLRNILSEKPRTREDIRPEWLKALQGQKKGDIIPELSDILRENFIEDDNHKWRVPNLQDDVDLEAMRLKRLLREFKIYVEVAQKPRGKIKEARVEALRAGFKQAYFDKDFDAIVKVADRIPNNLLTEDPQLLQFYQIALSRV